METFIPPIMKNIGVMIANATVLNLALTSPFCVFLKWSESITPSINAGNMACPPPRLPKNINPKSKTKTYFISSSPILFLNNGFRKINQIYNKPLQELLKTLHKIIMYKCQIL